MSGGAWNYAYRKIEQAIEDMPDAIEYRPLIEHLKRVADVMKRLEWHCSYDDCLTIEDRARLVKSVSTDMEDPL